MRAIIFFVFFVSFFFFLSPVSAEKHKNELLPVITIINPLRGKELGHQKDDLLASLKAQWQVTKDVGVPATWLWQYTALEDESMVAFAKSSMPSQEFGLLFEIDSHSAQKAGVRYRGQGPSYFSDGIFLASYDVDERKKLIDTSFALFKKQFGYYPKTVGAWWIGADSLTYMQKKYGIVAALKASEQYNMDVYSLWGAPWNIPYVASSNHEGIPANAKNNSHVVIMQWADRDPTYGYADATFSIQDFGLQGYDFPYVDYLFSLFLQKPLDAVVVGVENGGNITTFEAWYKSYIAKAKALEDKGKINVLLVSDFAKKFLAQKKTFANNADTRYFLSKSYQSDDQSFWYNAENFRAGILKIKNEIYLVDLRDYSKKVHEDFSLVPNSQGHLRITTPVIVDSMQTPSSKIRIAKSDQQLRLTEKGDSLTIFAGKRKIAAVDKTSLAIFTDQNGTKTFTFTERSSSINIFGIVIGIFSLYFLLMCLHKKNFKDSASQFALLLIPLFLAYPFLSQGMFGDLNVVFDKKMLLLFSYLSIPSSLSILQFLLAVQIVPFFMLLIIHYLFVVRSFHRWSSYCYYFFLIVMILLYAHVPYFPLDKSTSLIAFLGLCIGASVLIALSVVHYKKTKSKKVLFGSLVGSVFILSMVVVTLVFSRTRIVLTPFELGALQVVKDKQKDVIVVSQIDYDIKPIYKAVEPMLYKQYHFAEKLTHTHWSVVMRPENDVVQLKDYQHKLIVIPRYLGGDFSDHEMKINNVKKIFDNRQIMIFEKR